MFNLGNAATHLLAGVRYYIVKSSVKWNSSLGNPYANNLARKSYIEDQIVAFAESSGINLRGADSVDVVSTEHAGGTNPNAPNHVTVHFLIGGHHLTTKHIPV
ncbi:hypothetical protein EV359DRAFT_65617 [Lentinula novae-zelandiae]|nr:hypothetical protein EV359DRAFT_65617 [Lentinula novae-zelandiae]